MRNRRIYPFDTFHEEEYSKKKSSSDKVEEGEGSKKEKGGEIGNFSFSCRIKWPLMHSMVSKLILPLYPLEKEKGGAPSSGVYISPCPAQYISFHSFRNFEPR